MKKFIFLFAMLLVFSLTASAQFSFTSKAGKKFSVSSAPQKTESRGGGFVMEFYYTVEGSDLVVYEVGKSKGAITNRIAVTNVKIDEINANSFKVQKINGGCYLQTGTPYTKFEHGSDFNADDKYSNSNLQIDFKSCDDANAFRTKVLGDAADEIDLGDLDLSLEDKPKPKSTMPAHLFSLLGGGSRKTYQFSRKTDEVWDMTGDSVFKVGKISGSGEDVQMLDKTDSFYVYKLKDNRLYNGDKATAYSLIGDSVCKSIGDGKCDVAYKISKDDETVYSLDYKGTKYKYYTIMGEASNEEIFIILALLEGLR
jgi:hypothetical protein